MSDGDHDETDLGPLHSVQVRDLACTEHGEPVPLRALVQRARTPGASQRFFLVCPECGRGYRIVARSVQPIAREASA